MPIFVPTARAQEVRRTPDEVSHSHLEKLLRLVLTTQTLESNAFPDLRPTPVH